MSRLPIHPRGVEGVLDLGEREHIPSCLITTSGNSANTDSIRQAKVIKLLGFFPGATSLLKVATVIEFSIFNFFYPFFPYFSLAMYI